MNLPFLNEIHINGNHSFWSFNMFFPMNSVQKHLFVIYNTNSLFFKLNLLRFLMCFHSFAQTHCSSFYSWCFLLSWLFSILFLPIFLFFYFFLLHFIFLFFMSSISSRPFRIESRNNYGLCCFYKLIIFFRC